MANSSLQSDRMGDLADRVIPELERAIEALVSQDGNWTKGRADTVCSLRRVLEGFAEISRSAADRKRSAEENDHDIAGILATIDRRIVELANAFAGRLGEDPSGASAG